MPKIIATDEKGLRRDTRFRSRFRRRWILLAAIVVLLAGAGGAYYWWVTTHQATTATVQKTAGTPKPNTGITIKSPDEYSSELSKATKTEDKVTLLQGLIGSQQLNGDMGGALKSAQELLTLDQSASTYAILGGLYQAQGDKVSAISAYKKAVELSPVTDNPDAYTDYNIYKQSLAQLQGGN